MPAAGELESPIREDVGAVRFRARIREIFLIQVEGLASQSIRHRERFCRPNPAVRQNLRPHFIDFTITWQGTKSYVHFTGTVGDNGIAHGTSTGIAYPVNLSEGPWHSIDRSPVALEIPDNSNARRAASGRCLPPNEKPGNGRPMDERI